MRPQNDSITELSKQSPIEPIDATSPDSCARRVKAQEVNCVPWSEWMIVPAGGWRFWMAMPNAFVTSVEV